MHRRSRQVPERFDERGVAMIMTIIIIMIAATLAAAVLLQGSNTNRHAGHSSHWNEALEVAESGVQQAAALIEASAGVPATNPIAGTSGDGTYTTTVTSLGRNRYQIDSTGTVGTGAGLVAERTIRVIMAPPPSFRYALFSLTDIDTKNNDNVQGDIWANGSVTIRGGNSVSGSITAANGYVAMESNSVVVRNIQTGDTASGGFAVYIDSTADVGGNVIASSTDPGCNIPPGHYKVGPGHIAGDATSVGPVTAAVDGTTSAGVCTAPPATEPIPKWSYNPLNYDPPPIEFSSPEDFNYYVHDLGNGDSLKGTYYITGYSGEAVDITGIEVAGDLTIIAMDAPITADQGAALVDNDPGSPDDKVMVLISFYAPPPNSACTDTGGNPADCAIGIKNDFTLAPSTAVLVYAPNGPVAFKNSADFYGAVYANNIVMKNNQSTIYDERVEQVVGFGPVTLEQESWIEL